MPWQAVQDAPRPLTLWQIGQAPVAILFIGRFYTQSDFAAASG